MAITYYNPYEEQQRQYRFTLQMLANFAMQRAAQKARAEEAKTALDWEKTKLTRAEQLAANQLILSGQAKEAEAEAGSVEMGGKQLVRVGPSYKEIDVFGRPAVMTSEGKIQFAPLPRKPTTRKVPRGDQIITEELDETTGKWNEVGRGPRYKPTTNITVDMGTTKSTKTELEKRLTDGMDSLAAMQSVRTKWKDHPEYAQLGFRIDQWWKSTGEKLNVKTLSSNEKKTLTQYSDARADAINQVNLEIKRMTGAQMSEKEAKRLRLPMPDPGEGLWPKDSHTVFMGKLEYREKAARAAVTRWNYLLSRGYSPKEIQEMVQSGEVDAVFGMRLEKLIEALP